MISVTTESAEVVVGKYFKDDETVYIIRSTVGESIAYKVMNEYFDSLIDCLMHIGENTLITLYDESLTDEDRDIYEHYKVILESDPEDIFSRIGVVRLKELNGKIQVYRHNHSGEIELRQDYKLLDKLTNIKALTAWLSCRDAKLQLASSTLSHDELQVVLDWYKSK